MYSAKRQASKSCSVTLHLTIRKQMNSAMSYEQIAILGIIICVLVIVAELLWLFSLAEGQESHAKKHFAAVEYIDNSLGMILNYPTQSTLKTETEALKEFVGDDQMRMDIMSDRILDVLFLEQYDDEQKAAACYLNDKIVPLDFYRDMLHDGNQYEKAFACRKIATFGGEDEIPEIRKLMDVRNADVSYNAAMALSAFGDEESVAQFIINCEKNYRYSHRIILELLDVYGGDMLSLARRIFEQCDDDYIKSTIIKGISDFRFTEFEDMYIEGTDSKNNNIKIACIKALGKIGKKEYEQALITASRDQNWVVRATAVKELGVLHTKNCLSALEEATQDKEWWVRFNAAKTLVECDRTWEHIEAVLNGYDKFASDAVKYALYKKYDINPNKEAKEILEERHASMGDKNEAAGGLFGASIDADTQAAAAAEPSSPSLVLQDVPQNGKRQSSQNGEGGGTTE